MSSTNTTATIRILSAGRTPPTSFSSSAAIRGLKARKNGLGFCFTIRASMPSISARARSMGIPRFSFASHVAASLHPHSAHPRLWSKYERSVSFHVYELTVQNRSWGSQEAEVLGQYSGNGDLLAVQRDRFSYHLGVAPKPPRKEPIRKYEGILSGLEQVSKGRPRAGERPEAVRDLRDSRADRIVSGSNGAHVGLVGH